MIKKAQSNMISKLVTPRDLSQFKTIQTKSSQRSRFRIYVRPNKNEVAPKVGSENPSRAVTARYDRSNI